MFAFATITSVELLPLYEAVMVAVADLGTPLEFETPGETKELPVPIPRLAGLDEVEVERLEFELSSEGKDEEVSVAGTPQSGAVTLSSPGAARLKRIEIEDLKITSTAADSFYLQGESGNLTRVVYGWDTTAGAAVTLPDGAAGSAKAVHILVRPASGSGFGPPVQAAPSFSMPGEGGAMYGPALGGASLALVKDGSKINATLTLNPPLAASRASMLVGHAKKTSLHDGLPNDVVAAPWSAANVKAIFDVRPSGIDVKAQIGGGGDTPAVAQFPSDPGDARVAVDFAPVARSLLNKAYPSSQGADLGLTLLFTAAAPGTLRVRLGTVKARYLRRPLAHGPATVTLRGVPESVDLVVPAALKPAAVSFTVDGTFGPGRLTLDSDTAVPDARHGLRVAGGVRLARRVALTAAEANLPLLRIALHGRASEKTELLLTLHKGDDVRIGDAVADPLSLEVDAAPAAGWHRVEYKGPGLLPPHPAALWLVVRATHGAFWWHGAPEGSGSTQRSPDDGATFGEVAGRPAAQVAVKEVDAPTANPWPLYPVSLAWRDGQLSADLAEVANRQAASGPGFRRFWIAGRAPGMAFPDGIGDLNGILRLKFACQRDVDLAVAEAVLAYDPWNA